MSKAWKMALAAAAAVGILAAVVAAQRDSSRFSQDQIESNDINLNDDKNIFRTGNDILWCCLSKEELAKCRAFATAVKDDNDRSDLIFGSSYRDIKCKLYQNKDECMRLIDEGKPTSPNIMAVDAGEVFAGGRYHSLVPILKEEYSVSGQAQDYYHSVAVIKKNTMYDVETLADLKGKKACFAKVGSLAGWTVPVFKLIDTGVMKIADCNNHVKSAIEFFGQSCAVNSLQDRYNPLGDNPHKFCELCGSDTPGVRCTDRDPFADYAGALNCLREKGDVAFLNDKVLAQSDVNPDDFELLCPSEEQNVVRDSASGSDESFGGGQGSYYSRRRNYGAVLARRPISEYESCSWGVSPGNALVVSSAMDVKERRAVQNFLGAAVDQYGGGFNADVVDDNNNRQQQQETFDDYGSGRQQQQQQQGFNVPFGGDRSRFGFPNSNGDNFDGSYNATTEANSGNNGEDGLDEERAFQLFESSPRYGMLRNLMFSDHTRRLAKLEVERMSYKDFLGKAYGGALISPIAAIEGVRRCPVGEMKLCVTSEAEFTKCVRMSTALRAQLLEPKMSCVKAESHVQCMYYIDQAGKGEAVGADVVALDAGDIYRAGWEFGLIPIMSEIYNLGTPHYYAVAVAHQRDNSSELIYLKRKNTCHTGVGHAAGWIIPMAWLIANERVRDYGCNSVRAAAEYFNKACAPGARSPYFQNRYEADYWEYSHLCDLCHGTAGRYCVRNHMEDYFGHTGAFRCLVEGGGHVAFVKHTTVTENCDGKRKEWWARNQLTSDYELLCRDGTRAPARDYKRCYLGKVKSNALVTSPRYGREKVDTFINLFKYAQQFYGQKVHDEFSFAMFYSEPPFADLIFQDATQQLVVIDPFERDYTRYLDKEFLKAYSIVECRSAADAKVAASAFALVISVIVAVLFA